MSITQTTQIVHLNAPTHFPIKLTNANFPIWRNQVESTLIGLDVIGFVDGSIKAPERLSDAATNTINPLYRIWNRQDRIILSALLGSVSETLQPVISSASSATDAWSRLATCCAASSRSRIVSLKAKLAKNPRGSRSIDTYMRDMRAIADDLALAQNPISEEDLVVHIFTQLGDEYNPIVAVVRVRTTPISFSELSDVLTDYERLLKDNEGAHQSLIATANATQRRFNTFPQSSGSTS
ncbi:PREDICTED: uncharacterized protein LOC109189542 [Ipomoea nil]|uniref:uncharacterized protein LOC109189542 n=1 Tax=Ipomoea nil TaxID=35883 RepID=UPI000901346A|nr:PREDICTED: uncharacterized protein LOC109189542 [Ipomoea nil]